MVSIFFINENRMDDIANKIVNKWKEIIESYSIEIKSINCFRMNKFYQGYPEIEYCYKVNFDFGINNYKGNIDFNPVNKILLKELEGHRIIIQFYPQGFIDELREDKLNQLGI